MNKKELTETDIRTKFITPAIVGPGAGKWDVMTQILEERFFTKGRVIVRGKSVTRGEAKKADYILFYKPNIPLAVIEAKDNNHTVGAGMQQALDYAEILDVPFAYSSNGDAFLEHDRTASGGTVEREISLDQFPTPEELWNRFRQSKGYTAEQESVATQDYYSDGSGKLPRYYQLVAINRTVDAIARGENRLLLVAAKITEFLKATDRYSKTIVFCENIDHAERMRQALVNANPDLASANKRYVMRKCRRTMILPCPMSMKTPVTHTETLTPTRPSAIHSCPAARSRSATSWSMSMTVVAERVQYLDADGKLITESLKDYTRKTVRSAYTSLNAFLNVWNDSERKQAVLDELAAHGVFIDELADLIGKGYDAFDLVCHVAFDRPPLTRKDRAERVKKRNVFAKYGEKARAVLVALLEKYADGGIRNIESLDILKVDPLTGFGTPVEIVKLFGGKPNYLAAVRELETELLRAKLYLNSKSVENEQILRVDFIFVYKMNSPVPRFFWSGDIVELFDKFPAASGVLFGGFFINRKQSFNVGNRFDNRSTPSDIVHF